MAAFDLTPDPKVLVALTHTPMSPLKGAEGRNARDEYARVDREKGYEKREMNRMAKGGTVKKKASSKSTVQARGYGLAKRGHGPTKLC